MSWYLFNNSPERQMRGIKVDGYHNLPNNRVILDWGMGELSHKKKGITGKDTIQYEQQNYDRGRLFENNNYQNITHPKYRSQQNANTIQNDIKVLTQSSDEEQHEQLFKELDNYGKKKEKYPIQRINEAADSYETVGVYNSQRNNKSSNILNQIGFDPANANRSKNKPFVDSESAKRMRFLQNSLLPGNRKDNMTAVLDYELNAKVASSALSASQMSVSSRVGNRKNDSQVKLGDGYNSFKPMKDKVKDMNQKLKQMYDYDEWCKRRETGQIRLG